MKGVTQRNGDSIRCIRRWVRRELAQPRDDALHFGFLGASISTDGLFDGGGRILVTGQSSFGSDEQDGSTGLSKQQRGSDIDASEG